MIRVHTLDVFPPPLIKSEDSELRGIIDVQGLLKKNEWDVNVFELTGDDGVLVLEAIYEDLDLITVFVGRLIPLIISHCRARNIHASSMIAGIQYRSRQASHISAHCARVLSFRGPLPIVL